MGQFGRDIAKVLTGIAIHETLGHWWLGTWGRDMLPLRLGAFEFTSTLNAFCMVAWPLALLGLVYFAWLRKDAAHAGRSLRPGLQ